MMIEFNDQVAEDSQLTMSPSSLCPSCSLLTVLVDRVVNADGTELLRSYIEVSAAMILGSWEEGSLVSRRREPGDEAKRKGG